MERGALANLLIAVAGQSLLNASDGDPVRANRIPVVESPFLLVGDHAGGAIPESLGGLGLSPADRSRHIALDLGVRQLGEVIGNRLGAPLLWQHFSRLVCDCNRHPGDAEWAPEISDGTKIPGNQGLNEKDLRARRIAIFAPYHEAIAATLDAREARGVPTVLVSLHSFTPVMNGEKRPWDISVLHDGREDAYARDVLSRLKEKEDYTVGENQPYDMDDTDYTVPHHAYPRNLAYIELEVRQDRIADPEGIDRISALLAEVLTSALPR